MIVVRCNELLLRPAEIGLIHVMRAHCLSCDPWVTPVENHL